MEKNLQRYRDNSYDWRILHLVKLASYLKTIEEYQTCKDSKSIPLLNIVWKITQEPVSLQHHLSRDSKKECSRCCPTSRNCEMTGSKKSWCSLAQLFRRFWRTVSNNKSSNDLDSSKDSLVAQYFSIWIWRFSQSRCHRKVKWQVKWMQKTCLFLFLLQHPQYLAQYLGQIGIH